MALNQYTADTDIIETLGTNPEDRPTLTDNTFKGKFDENAANIKAFLNAMIAELASTAAGKGASQIGIEDSGSKFTAATVEAALAESATLISTKVNPNAIINGCFRVNQRVKSGTVTLAAGAYGHDRWKAGTSGCTYTFATSGGVTIITITAGSLIQVIEGQNLETATYCLSWTGTAQGKIGAGSLSASGVTGSVTGGSDLSIEFSTGTLSKVKLEKGSVATPFTMHTFAEELMLCQRYYETNYYFGKVPGTTFGISAGGSIEATSSLSLYKGQTATTARVIGAHMFKTRKRLASPTMRYWDLAGNLSKVTTLTNDFKIDSHNISETYQGVSSTDVGISFQTGASCFGAAVMWEADSEL